MRKILYLAPLLILVYSLFFSSCRKEEFETGDLSLSFSEDTIMFDTVFTSVGSATEIFQVYNDGDKNVKISSIRLAMGQNSNFRINVDGISGSEVNNVEIGAKDSIFIFVEVTVDPNNLLTPLVITDSILFSSEGFEHDIKLVAWGQDAYFHRPSANSQIAPYFFADTVNQVINWHNDKPHVIYGYAMVDSSQTLVIDPGTNVYLHPGSGIIVLSSGSLQVNGTLQNNVTFQGDRLGIDYSEIPGQWDRIWISNLNLRTNVISPSAINSSIKYAVIKNGTIGLLVDTAYDTDTTHLTLSMENTIIKNMTLHALALRGSKVSAYNCVMANCGAQTTNILYGGQYRFYHCTFANYWNNGARQDPAVSLNNYFDVFMRPLNAYFGNCILYGNNDNELGLDSFPSGNQFGFLFDHSLIKVESSFPTTNTAHYASIIKAFNGSNNPAFADVENNDYRLDSATSAAVNKGDITITNLNPLLQTDILGNSRLVTAPDLGAYERY